MILQKGARDLQPSRLRLEKTGHVLDTEDVDALCNKLVDEVEVVLEGVFRLLWIGNITSVADNGLANTTSFLSGVNTKSQLYAHV